MFHGCDYYLVECLRQRTCVNLLQILHLFCAHCALPSHFGASLCFPAPPGVFQTLRVDWRLLGVFLLCAMLPQTRFSSPRIHVTAV